MVTKELVDFVRAEFAKGTTKERLMTLLMSEGWAALDTQEAFNAAAKPEIAAPQTIAPQVVVTSTPFTVAEPVAMTGPVQKKSQGLLMATIIILLVLCIGAGTAFLWLGTDTIKGMLSPAQTEMENAGIVFDNINVVEGTDVSAELNAPEISAVNSSFNKDAVIAGVLRSQTTLRSKDITKIREYMLLKATTTAQKKQLNSTSDKDLLFGVDLINVLQPEVTEEILRSEDTVFTQKSEGSVEISFTQKGTTARVTLYAFNIQGEWY